MEINVVNEQPNYYAVIPSIVRYDTKINANAKLLYGEISALSNKYGYCVATNEYFSSLYNVSTRTITGWIKSLEDKAYIKCEIDIKRYEDGTIKKVRKIYIHHIEDSQHDHIEVSRKNHIEENFAYNNTSNINNTSKKEIYKERKFKKPTLEEVREYCKERNNNINAESFIDFYESKGWMVGKNKMKDWKACVRTWEKRARTKAMVVETIPGWFDKEQDIKLMTKQEEEEMESLLGGVI